MSTLSELRQKAWDAEKKLHPGAPEPAKRYYVRLTLEESNAITPSPVNFHSTRLDELIIVFDKPESARIAYYGVKPVLEKAIGAK